VTLLLLLTIGIAETPTNHALGGIVSTVTDTMAPIRSTMPSTFIARSRIEYAPSIMPLADTLADTDMSLATATNDASDGSVGVHSTVKPSIIPGVSSNDRTAMLTVEMFTAAGGCDTTSVAGGDRSTSTVTLAGEVSTLPATSTAATSMVCSPSDTPATCSMLHEPFDQRGDTVVTPTPSPSTSTTNRVAGSLLDTSSDTAVLFSAVAFAHGSHAVDTLASLVSTTTDSVSGGDVSHTHDTFVPVASRLPAPSTAQPRTTTLPSATLRTVVLTFPGALHTSLPSPSLAPPLTRQHTLHCNRSTTPLDTSTHAASTTHSVSRMTAPDVATVPPHANDSRVHGGTVSTTHDTTVGDRCSRPRLSCAHTDSE
jgi:hypothetical protein